ncbi:PqqD family protein [Halomonas urumqiensis]|uniref:Peptidase M50 n=1 Tax=Halomonas urumqiensis TaxID=1684789 RepID=A0A2N7UD16_9GAMM|nr:PqqD family protein [Halomonas urumqiensis]PMR78281.1 peptidase M50 [Halomonas urumqiensis]PTB03428.1 peptidase M50 [Halomonas urumqiensis]GHE20393.1 hemolysin D [Halomonas urumqiensis]
MMVGSYFSANWYRVAGLRPRLRRHVVVHRHVVRGDVWHVLQDDQTGGFFRITPAAYRFLAGLDGRHTVAEVWESVARRVGDDHLSQDDVIVFLGQLHRSDMLIGQDLPDLGELFDRSRSNAKRTVMSRVKNPLALRLPLFDPDKFLNRITPAFAWLLTPLGMALWLLLVGYGVVLAALNWPGLTHNIYDRVISLDTLLFFIVLYPLMKAVHELAHGVAVKAWGGQVHEMGIMFLVFMPVPYVDASAASGFRRRRRRAVVAGIGIMVELMLAALAMIVWAMAEPGLVRATAFNVMLIGGASTLLFNGNPLLRFDGYYVLCDALDIPNLGTRSNKYLFYLVQRYGFGKRDGDNPATARGERKWFVLYGVLSFCYRVFIMIMISLFVATKFFFIGVILACLSVTLTVLWPLWKGWRYVFHSRQLGQRQGRAKLVTLTLLGLVGLGLFAVPVLDATVSHGVVWTPTQGRLVASNSGFVDQVHAANGEQVDAGEPVITLRDPQLDARIATLEAEEREYRSQYNRLNLRDPGQARILAEQLERTSQSLAFWKGRQARNQVMAPQPGAVAMAGGESLPGKLVAEGTLLGYVFSDAPRLLEVLVPQDRINDIRYDTLEVSLRFPGALHQQLPGRILGVTPRAVDVLPSGVLSTEGGGPVFLDPEAEQPRPLNNYYVVRIGVEEPQGVWRAEERALVRFRHSPTPLGIQALRAIREVFLSQFDV